MSEAVKKTRRLLHVDVGEELYRIIDDMAKETHLSKSRIGREAVATFVNYYQRKDHINGSAY